jgi:hypothetical protein
MDFHHHACIWCMPLLRVSQADGGCRTLHVLCWWCLRTVQWLRTMMRMRSASRSPGWRARSCGLGFVPLGGPTQATLGLLQRVVRSSIEVKR